MDRGMENLIKKAKAHDPDAFTGLMDQQMPGFYKVARAILQNDDDAADAIQDTLLTCWEKMDTLRENRFFKTWATKILINHCYGILRRKKSVAYVEELPELSAEPENFDMEWKEALSYLQEEYRIIVILYYAQGFKTKEIASLLRIPDGTVRTRLSRARKLLKDYYQKEE